MSKNLTITQRSQIQAMLDHGYSKRAIADYIGCHRSSVYRELTKFSIDGKYCYQAAQEQASRNMARHHYKGPADTIVQMIEARIINDQWSPEQISNWMKKHGYAHVSHTWIYQHIDADKEQGGELANHLRRGSYSKEPREYRGKIANRVSIIERPEEVNARARLGDYEIDLIVGPKNRGAILSIIDRVSRKCLLEKLTGKTASEVATGVIAALLPYKSFIFTITSDNGTEFTHHEEIAKALGIQYYFANPYASYERGSIENLNGLVRQYIPKGTDFNLISPEEIKVIEEKLNNRPRKVLDYWTPNEFLRQNAMKVA